MVTETMMLLAIRQKNWQQALVIARELANRAADDALLRAIPSVIGKCQAEDPRARILLSLWAELRWREKQ